MVINEIESSGGSPGDWVELFNKGTSAVDMSGWMFRDSDDTRAYTLPAGTIIAAGGYLVLDETTNFSFGLGQPDSARLFAADGVTVIDSHTWMTHATHHLRPLPERHRQLRHHRDQHQGGGQ